MSAPNGILPEHLARLIGTPACPAIIDVRTEADFTAFPRLIPGAIRRDAGSITTGSSTFGQSAVMDARGGRKISEGFAAWLRHAGTPAAILEGGIDAWSDAGCPTIPASRIPDCDDAGRTVWVTRARPKIDRIACPWLIRRFVDPAAVFLFVAASEVQAVAERFGATPFDVDGVHWTHRGDFCTFDVMVEEFGLSTDALRRLAMIVRAADTARLDLAPEAPGLLAASLGLSQMYDNDLRQLEAGLLLYDAFFRWCRNATAETHNWPSPTNKTKAEKVSA